MLNLFFNQAVAPAIPDLADIIKHTRGSLLVNTGAVTLEDI